MSVDRAPIETAACHHTSDAEKMQIITVKIEKPDDINFILGQSHFIKTVEDLHEALVQTVPGIKFGLGFCEASGEMLVRWTGTDGPMIELAKRNALSLAAGHAFILFLGPGFFPVNVLKPGQIGPGGLPYILRHGESGRGDYRRNRAGTRHPRRHRRREKQRN